MSDTTKADDLFGAESPAGEGTGSDEQGTPLPAGHGSGTGVGLNAGNGHDGPDDEEEVDTETEADKGDPEGFDFDGMAGQRIGPGNPIATVRLLMLFGWTDEATMPNPEHLALAFECLPATERVLLGVRAGIGTEPRSDAAAARLLRTKAQQVKERVDKAKKDVTTAIGVITRLPARVMERSPLVEFQSYKLAKVLADLTVAVRTGDGRVAAPLMAAEAALADAQMYGLIRKL